MLGICSYNSKKVICKALNIVGLADFFDASLIYGREIWESKGSGRWSKADVIRAHIMAGTGMPARDTLFADDDPGHCRDVATALPDVCVIQVPQPLQRARASNLPKAGSECSAVLNHTRSSHACTRAPHVCVCRRGSASGAHGCDTSLGDGAWRVLRGPGRGGPRCAEGGTSGRPPSCRGSSRGGPNSRICTQAA